MTVNFGFRSTLFASPGKGDEVVDFLLTAPPMSNPDCLVFLIERSTANPDVVHLSEGWTSKEAHRAFIESNEAQLLVKELQRLTTEESVVSPEMPVGGKAKF